MHFSTFYKFIFTIFFTFLLGGFTFCNAQSLNKWNYTIYYQTHQFYDSGQYKLSSINNAKATGLGFSIEKPLNNAWSVSGGYGISFVDSLRYNEFYTTLAPYQKVDVNIALRLLERSKFSLKAFSGYTFNYIGELEKYGVRESGVSIANGIETRVRLKNEFWLSYKLSYNFSISENIPFHWNHRWGIVYNPMATTMSRSKEALIDKLRQSKIRNDSLTLENIELLHKTESLSLANIELRHHKNKINDSIRTACKVVIDSLLDENQVLKSSFGNEYQKPFVAKVVDKESYTIIKRDSLSIYVSDKKVPVGYYLVSQHIGSFKEAESTKKLCEYEVLDMYYIINKGDQVYLAGFISTEKLGAEMYYRDVPVDNKYHHIYYFR